MYDVLEIYYNKLVQMQDQNSTYAKKVLSDLSKYLGVNGIKGLANYFCVDPNKFYSWIKRGSIADTGLILGKHPELNKAWLDTGEGEMLRTTPFVVAEELTGFTATSIIRKIGPEENELLDSWEKLDNEGKAALLHLSKLLAGR